MNLIAGLTGGGGGTASSAPMSSKSSSCTEAFEVAPAAGHGEVVPALVPADVVEISADTAGVSGVAAGTDLEVTGIAGDAAVVGAPGLTGSPLRRSPRATRSVPLACSMLMGLVRTRLAPMRNAFATPA